MAHETVLHIGFHKTGTKSIQHLLTENAPAFADQGVLIPVALPPVRRLLSDHLMFEDVCSAFPWRVRHSAHDLARAADGLQDQIRRWPGRVIVSSEMLSFASAPAVRRIVDFFAAASDTVSIVAYVRPQAAALVSWAIQEVKMGRVAAGYCATPEMAIPRRSDGMSALDYSGILDLWARNLGHDHLAVRLFRRDIEMDWDVQSDFCAALGVSAPTVGNVMLNRAIPPAAVEFLNRMNGALPTGLRRHDRSAFVASLAACALTSLGPRQAHTIATTYLRSNKRLDALLEPADRGAMNRFSPTEPDSQDWPFELRADQALDFAHRYLQIVRPSRGAVSPSGT